MNPILEGLQIIAKYDPDFDMCAEHDQIWAGEPLNSPLNTKPMSEEDVRRMKDLKWFIDLDYEGAWSHFV